MIAGGGRRDLGFDLGKLLGGHAAAQIELELDLLGLPAGR